MVRSSLRAFCTLNLMFVCSFAYAQQKNAYDILPDNTQAVVWVRNGDELLERWHRTQLAQLAEDEAVAPFFREQRQAIEKRFMDAGWRLVINPEDLSEYAVGQIALAWTDKQDTPLKPFAMTLIADVSDDEVINKQMMEMIEEQLDSAEMEKQVLSHAGVSITKYRLPPRSGELISQDSYFAIIDGLMISTDDEQFIKQLIDSHQGKSSVKSLANEADFEKGRSLAEISGKGHIEYFVRPLGFARVIRSIGGQRSKSTSDMLAVLQNQGFGEIRCFAGELIFGQVELDIQHRGYVYAKRPLPKSAQVLDFLNKASRDVPSFVGEDVSSFLATHWNAKEAFWKTEGLVDEIAGTEGVFAEVIEGIKKDPNGPRIDMKNVLDLFTNDIFSVSDSEEGDADVDSRRNLIALKVNDPAKMSEILNRAMKGEPDAEMVEFEGHEIWKVVHREDQLADPGGFDDFGAIDEPVAAAGNEPQPWLSNWAITVHDSYLMFASHVEMIQDAIVQAKTSNTSPLAETEDYRRITAAIEHYFSDEDTSAWKISRTDKAFRVQYELFRKGELKNSQSMLSSILDRLLQNESEIRDNAQKIDGKELPEFSAIAKYLQPRGMMVRTTDDGWEFSSLLLSDKFTYPASVSNTQIGTARVSNSEAEANR